MPNTDFNITRNELVIRSLKKIGHTNPANSEVADAIGTLNIIVKELDPTGRWLWAISNTETQLDIVQSVSEYGVAAPPLGIADDILRLENFEVVKGNNNRTPVRIVDKTRSLQTFERESFGEPFEVNLDRKSKLSEQRIIIRPVPNGPYLTAYTYQRRLFDFDNPADNPDFPGEWMNPLIQILSADLSDEYGLPLPERQLLKTEARVKRKEAKAANQENFDPVRLDSEYY